MTRHNCLENKFFRIFQLIAVLMLNNSACRPSEDGGSSSYIYNTPDYLSDSGQYVWVPDGSDEVVTSPPEGAYSGKIVLRLYAAKGKKIQYGFFEDQLQLAPKTYSKPLVLYPPVEIWTQTSDGDETFKYSFTRSSELFELPEPLELGFPISAKTDDSDPFAPRDAATKLTQTEAKIVTDGKDADWQNLPSRLDGDGDLPAWGAMANITDFQAHEDDGIYYFRIATKTDPMGSPFTTYAVELGVSNITADSFGAGAQYLYTFSTKSHTTTARRSSDNETFSPEGLEFAYGQALEMKVPKSSLPALADKANIIARAYTVDWRTGEAIIDRTEPQLLEHAFETYTLSAELEPARQLDFQLMKSSAAGDETFANDYLTMSNTLVSDIEALTAIPFFGVGSVPIYYLKSDVDGYAGLNTTDRGLLTTIGPNEHLLSQAQLMAHELVHYQNARLANGNLRWIQEGHSEWTSEKLMYRYFPARAVYRYMQHVRYSRYFDAVNGETENLPLADWDGSNDELGYEKSLMFFRLLENQTSAEVIHKLLQFALNDELNSEDAKRFVEAQNDADLSELFSGWILSGDKQAAYLAEKWFLDEDKDGLLAIDEDHLGTDPNDPDSDNDGYLDGEEYFQAKSPTVSNLSNISNLVPKVVDKESTLPFFRLGGRDGEEFYYDFDANTTAPEEKFTTPVLVYPPYSVAIQSKTNAQSGSVLSHNQSLVVGTSTKVVNFDDDLVLPASAKTTVTYESGIDLSADLDLYRDISGDLPEALNRFDIAASSMTLSDGSLQIELDFAGAPPKNWEFGGMTISFNAIDWDLNNVKLHRHYVVSVVNGSFFLYTYENGKNTATEKLVDGLTTNFGDKLTLNFDLAKLNKWQSSTLEKQVCLATEPRLDSGKKLYDRERCYVFGGDFSRESAAVADTWGLTDLYLEVFLDTDDYTSARMERIKKVGLSALRHFEKVRGRPLWWRTYWPLHVGYNSSSSTSGAASTSIGAYVHMGAGLAEYAEDYLIVEQLARLFVADLLVFQGAEVDYWLQELYIQWLTTAAMSGIHKTKSVHSFHEARIDDYLCYTNTPTNLCPGYFTSDAYLKDWNSSNSGTTASTKSLMLMLNLHATLGSANFAKVMSTFDHRFPKADRFASQLKNMLPAKSSQIDDLFKWYVNGSGNSTQDRTNIRGRFADSDGDKLYLFEEEFLGTSDNSSGSYLN